MRRTTLTGRQLRVMPRAHSTVRRWGWCWRRRRRWRAATSRRRSRWAPRRHLTIQRPYRPPCYPLPVINQPVARANFWHTHTCAQPVFFTELYKYNHTHSRQRTYEIVAKGRPPNACDLQTLWKTRGILASFLFAFALCEPFCSRRRRRPRRRHCRSLDRLSSRRSSRAVPLLMRPPSTPPPFGASAVPSSLRCAGLDESSAARRLSTSALASPRARAALRCRCSPS